MSKFYVYVRMYMLQRRMLELKSFLIKQHYPEQIIEHGLQKAMSLDKNVLRTVTRKEKRKYSGAMVLGKLPVPGRPTNLD